MKRMMMVAALAASFLAVPGAAVAEDAKKSAKQQAKVIDPVCGMEVDPKTAEKSVYKGKTYYFCARTEKEQFDKTPEKFVKPEKKK
jgi:YHS domain-containing protein